MTYRVWYSTEAFADYIIANTELRSSQVVKKKLYESDANNSALFHTMPDHIKKILYLDAPDLIVEFNSEPIFTIEVSTEAGTGHNAFQRFARLAASVENNVTAFYIYPEAVIVTRNDSSPVWDKINPLILQALDDVMSIYRIPALLYYFPSEFRTHADPTLAPNISKKGLKFEPTRSHAGSPLASDAEMQQMFFAINEVLDEFKRSGVVSGREKLLSKRSMIARRSYMRAQYAAKGGSSNASPLTATITIPTSYLLNYLSQYETGSYRVGELLRAREESVIYKVNSKFRGDPYPGALAAIDYLSCREGRSFEERKYNLIMAWGDVVVDHDNETIRFLSYKASVDDFVSAVQASENKNILKKSFSQIRNDEISRYYMQVRYGSTFSKVKHIRIYSYFADAILFHDGSFWRDA